MSPCGVGSPVHLDNQPASTVATLASVKPTVIRYISLLIPTELDSGPSGLALLLTTLGAESTWLLGVLLCLASLPNG